MKRIWMGLVVAAAALALAAPASAQTAKTAKTAKTEKADSTAKMDANKPADHHFVSEALKGGMAEVELGQLAADKGSSEEVKKFGKRMVDDHGKAEDELKSLAQKKNIEIPREIDSKDKALKTRLSKLNGRAFDKAYMH